MRSSLFWRAFAALMALTLCTVALCTAAVAAFMQAERQGVYENEVRQQAYEVADYRDRGTGCNPQEPQAEHEKHAWQIPLSALREKGIINKGHREVSFFYATK